MFLLFYVINVDMTVLFLNYVTVLEIYTCPFDPVMRFLALLKSLHVSWLVESITCSEATTNCIALQCSLIFITQGCWMKQHYKCMQIAHFVNTGPDLHHKFSQDSLAGKIQNRSHTEKKFEIACSCIVEPKKDQRHSPF